MAHRPSWVFVMLMVGHSDKRRKADLTGEGKTGSFYIDLIVHLFYNNTGGTYVLG